MAMLVLVSAFFSSSETAFFFLTRDQLRHFSSQKGRMKLVAELMGNPDRLLTGILFWNLVINLAYFSVGLVVVNQLSGHSFPGIAAAFGIFNLVGMIVVGEVLPKSFAAAHATWLARLVAWPLAAAVALLDPAIPWLGRIARVFRQTFWPHVRREAQLKPEDLEHALDTSAALGRDVQHAEQHVLHNVLDLNEIQAEEVMRPRSHCLTVPPDGRIPTTRLPFIHANDYLVVTDSEDEVISGVVALNDAHSAANRTFLELAEPVVFVPWCATLAEVLTQLESRFRSVAIVIHEHGEMVGMLTIDDLMAMILTESPSRTRRLLRRDPVIEVDADHYHAEGLVTLRFLARELRVVLTVEDESLFTLAGLFQERLQRIAQTGDQLLWHEWQLTAIQVTERGLVRVLVEPAELTREQEPSS